MPKNKNQSNSFTIEEIRLIRQLFHMLMMGSDTRVIIHTKSFRSVYKKFNAMYEKYKAKEVQGDK